MRTVFVFGTESVPPDAPSPNPFLSPPHTHMRTLEPMKLRADLNHAMSKSTQEEQIGKIVKQVKTDTSQRYEAKISKIESRLHELVAHNKALTSELSKWTVDDGMFYGFEEDGESLDEDFPMKSDLLDAEKELDNDEIDGTARSYKGAETDPSGEDKAPSEASETNHFFPAASTSNARARLQKVRESLELVASKPILHSSRPGKV